MVYDGDEPKSKFFFKVDAHREARAEFRRETQKMERAREAVADALLESEHAYPQWKAQQRGRGRTEAQMRAELSELESKRDELCSRIGEELLELYGELLGSKHNLAVVKVIDGVCQGCRVELPGMEYDRFLKSDAVFRCGNCGRIMVK